MWMMYLCPSGACLKSFDGSSFLRTWSTGGESLGAWRRRSKPSMSATLRVFRLPRWALVVEELELSHGRCIRFVSESAVKHDFIVWRVTPDPNSPYVDPIVGFSEFMYPGRHPALRRGGAFQDHLAGSVGPPLAHGLGYHSLQTERSRGFDDRPCC